MRTRALRRSPAVPIRRPSPAALVFLRGRDADGRLRELVAERGAARPVLGALAAHLVRRRAFEPLGFRSLSDWSRERLGIDARTVREWSRVWRALEDLPLLRTAVHTGEVSWTVARKIVSIATPETDAACLETVRGRTVRAVEVLLRAVSAPPEEEGPDEDRVRVRIPCSPEVATKWVAACELARRIAGEELPASECAEAIAAECTSTIGAAPGSDPVPAPSGPRHPPIQSREPGLRATVWPHLSWRASRRRVRLASLTRGLEDATPLTLDRRLRAATALLQHVDLEIGRILKQILERKLLAELGFESFERYVEERLDLSARTARRLVRLARAEGARPEVASAFREGRITLLQAELLLRGGTVERARRVTLRRLEDDLPRREVVFSAPREVAILFGALVQYVGLEKMLDHAIATWLEQGAQFTDYADFERDGFRCTVPACSARKNLQSHHILYRSAGGPDEPWNRTTLCAFHHHRGVHAHTLTLRGRAPDALVYRLAVGTFRSHDERYQTYPAGGPPT